jgi:hypothetical protein
MNTDQDIMTGLVMKAGRQKRNGIKLTEHFSRFYGEVLRASDLVKCFVRVF